MFESRLWQLGQFATETIETRLATWQNVIYSQFFQGAHPEPQ